MWATTTELEIFCDTAPSQINALERLLRSIPENKIEVLTFGSHSRLPLKSFEVIHWFLLRQQSTLRILTLPKVAGGQTFGSTAFAVRIGQKKVRSQMDDVVFIEDQEEPIGEAVRTYLMEGEAKASSVKVWGTIEVPGYKTDPFIWDFIDQNCYDESFLSDVTDISLFRIKLENPGLDHWDISSATQLLNVTALHIQDCPGASSFLQGTVNNFGNLRRFVLRTDFVSDMDMQIVRNFIGSNPHLEELGLHLRQNLENGIDAYVPATIAVNLKRLYLPLKELTSTSRQAPQYLKDTTSRCPNLTHLGTYLEDINDPYLYGKTNHDWETTIHDLSVSFFEFLSEDTSND